MQEFKLLALIVIMLYGGALDLIPVYHFQGSNIEIFLTDRFIQVEPFLTLGTLIRPIINFMVLILFLQRIKSREPKK